VVSKIDGATGEVTVNPETTFSRAGEEHLVCPGQNGGKNFQAGAYSPLNNALFMPTQNACATMSPISDKPIPNNAYGLTVKPQFAPGATNIGTIHAVSVATGRTLWEYASRAGALSLKAHDAAGALPHLTQAVADGRREATTYLLLAQAHLQTGHVNEAREAVSNGLGVDPRNQDLLRLRRTIK
jgi:hypothetical protein